MVASLLDCPFTTVMAFQSAISSRVRARVQFEGTSLHPVHRPRKLGPRPGWRAASESSGYHHE
ncbi:MAG: hypothetical protein AUI33_17710 [Ignavibacteria bacterium 13_1_40CM_2_61_4]|nr:MAG: hypothetical protein AUI33_17710 [Ignavibacteria bacterium 13_1_40CM_2_61_4]